jgi:hypothetical protein
VNRKRRSRGQSRRDAYSAEVAATHPRVTRQTTIREDDDRPPICPRCGVTMVPATLSAENAFDGEWVCLECEELGEEG